MKVYYITFRSVTFAQRGEQLIKNTGKQVSLLRTPKWMESQGCGYSLRIRTGDVWEVIGLLRENGVNFRRVYLQLANGSLEEMAI